MPKKKKNKNKKGKKGGKQETFDAPAFEDPDETLEDYYEEAPAKTKKKKFTGFETADEVARDERNVVTELSDDEVQQTSGKKSRAQLKKEKKARDKKRKEEEAKRKAEEAAKKKKKSSKYDDDYSDSYDDPPPKKKGKGKKYDDDYDDYSDSYDDKPKKKKKSSRKYSDEYSDYSDSYEAPKKKKGGKKSSKKDDYYSDEDDYSDSYDAPKKKGKGKKKKKYSEDDYYSDDYSDYSDEPPKKKGKGKAKGKAKKKKDYYSDEEDSFYSDEDSYDKPKKKKTAKGKKKKVYSDEEDSFYSDEDSYDTPKKGKKGKYSDSEDEDDRQSSKKGVNKKDPTKGPSKRSLKKKAAKAKKKKGKYDDLFDEDDEPAAPKPEKRRPTMSDDEDSDDFAKKKKPVKKPEKKKSGGFSGFAALNEWSDEEEEEDDDEFNNYVVVDEPEPKKEPEPEKEEPVKIDWKKKKKGNKKSKKDDDIDKEFADLFKEEPKKMSKAALKRQRQRERKEKLEAEAAMGVTPDQKKPQQQTKKPKKEKKLSKKEQERLEKFEAEKRRREEAKKKAEEEEKLRILREEEERKQAELDRIQREKEKAERRKLQQEKAKKDRAEKAKAERLKKMGVSNFDAKKRAEEAAARREAKKNKRNKQRNKRREEEEARRREEEEMKRKREERERQEKEEAERKKREEEERIRKEEEAKAARQKRIREMEEEARRGVISKKKAAPEQEDSSGDEWEDDESDEEVQEDEEVPRSEEEVADDWEDDESNSEEEEEPPQRQQGNTPLPPEDGGWEDDESDDNDDPKPDDRKEDENDPPKKPAKEKEEEEEVEAKKESDKPSDGKADPKEDLKAKIERHRKKDKEVIQCGEKKTLKKIAEKMKEISKKCGGKIKIDAKLGRVTVTCKNVKKLDATVEEVLKIMVKQMRKEIDMSRLRAPIGVIMGNVDAGKTKLLDYIRGTKVQDGEAGGITQQIGATNLPMSYIKQKAGEAVVSSMLGEVHLPGLLIIDTPGHGAFSNLRKRGSAMCDVAIVVVNIFNGIEGTSAQCITMLKDAGAPFVVALNQIDRLTGWQPMPGIPIKEAIEQQSRNTKQQFQQLYKNLRAQFASECQMNADLFWESSDLQRGKLRSDNVNCIPTSAHSGDGVPDLLMLWVKLCQIRKLAKRLVLSPQLRCTVLEVKKVQGLGHTIDVIVSDGSLRQGDTIAVCGMKGPIIGKIKGLLTPKKLQDLRVKIVEYDNLAEVHASAGVRIAIMGGSLEDAVPGSPVLKIEDPKDASEVDDVKDLVQAGLQEVENLQKDPVGVYIVASTLGALEALYGFVKEEVKIPISGISIGTVRRRDITKASTMLEKKPEYAVILAFDVQVTADAAELAEDLGVMIMTSDIIYQLDVQFREYIDSVSSQFKDEYRKQAVFPVLMEVIPNKVFARKDPIIFGVEVKRGTLRLGTPICALDEGSEPLFIGEVTSIQGDERKELEKAPRGSKVAIRIDLTNDNSTKIEYKRHFSEDAKLISRISRESIDTLKMYFKDEIDRKEDVPLLKKLMVIFNVK